MEVEGVDCAACELPTASDLLCAVVGWRVINLPSLWVATVPPGSTWVGVGHVWQARLMSWLIINMSMLMNAQMIYNYHSVTVLLSSNIPDFELLTRHETSFKDLHSIQHACELSIDCCQIRYILSSLHFIWRSVCRRHFWVHELLSRTFITSMNFSKCSIEFQ